MHSCDNVFSVGKFTGRYTEGSRPSVCAALQAGVVLLVVKSSRFLSKSSFFLYIHQFVVGQFN